MDQMVDNAKPLVSSEFLRAFRKSFSRGCAARITMHSLEPEHLLRGMIDRLDERMVKSLEVV